MLADPGMPDDPDPVNHASETVLGLVGVEVHPRIAPDGPVALPRDVLDTETLRLRSHAATACLPCSLHSRSPVPTLRSRVVAIVQPGGLPLTSAAPDQSVTRSAATNDASAQNAGARFGYLGGRCAEHRNWRPDRRRSTRGLNTVLRSVTRAASSSPWDGERQSVVENAGLLSSSVSKPRRRLSSAV